MKVSYEIKLKGGNKKKKIPPPQVNNDYSYMKTMLRT